MKLYRLVTLAIAAAPLIYVPVTAQTGGTGKPAAGGTQTAKPAPAGAAAAKGTVRTIDIVGTDQMKYDLTEIPAKRNEQLRIRLTSKGTMPKIAMAHNWVLLKLGTSQVKFITAGAQSRQTDFIPDEMKDQVIAKTALAGAGETVEVSFKAPAAAGKYPYVCTFPGHFQAGMRGTLNVK
jgi:azurin